MSEKYEKIFFVAYGDILPQVSEAIKGLDAKVIDVTFDQGKEYFYVLIDPKDKAEFDRRMDEC